MQTYDLIKGEAENMKNFYRAIILLLLLFTLTKNTSATDDTKNIFRITAYCACAKCTHPFTDGRFASGKKVYVGGVACNFLPFGTKLLINNTTYTVEDRGARSVFGTKDNPIKAIDIYFPCHEQALQFGVQYKEVIIL
jgi:3D (Asp-Asp-Asp) domain-containing protein